MKPPLRYQAAYVNFIYSFAWDVTKVTFEKLWETFSQAGIKEQQAPKWKKEKLHERYMDFNGHNRKYGAYRPSLLAGCQDALYLTDEISNGSLEVIAPLKNGWQSNQMDKAYLASCPVSLKYYMRILENGSGVCTLSVRLDKDVATFENIHRVLHLGQNLAFAARDTNNVDDKTPYACSYLRHSANANGNCWVKTLRARNQVVVGGQVIKVKRDSLVNGDRLPQSVFSVQELVNRLLLLNPEHLSENWVDPVTPNQSLWLDWDLLDWKQDVATSEYFIEHPWQNPFAFTICELPAPPGRQTFSAKKSLNRRVKELAATLTKMNLDNTRIISDFGCIGNDYMSSALPFNANTKTLLNLSHDDRLFFSFSRRGALAVTTRMDTIPGYFVLPSFVNLLEILRARWHLGNIVNLELDDAIEALVAGDTTKPEDVLEKVYRARLTLSMFLRDPVPYLFDGGAVTDIAGRAETELWLARLREAASEKFLTVDRLIQQVKQARAYEGIQRRMELAAMNQR